MVQLPQVPQSAMTVSQHLQHLDPKARSSKQNALVADVTNHTCGFPANDMLEHLQWKKLINVSSVPVFTEVLQTSAS